MQKIAVSEHLFFSRLFIAPRLTHGDAQQTRLPRHSFVQRAYPDRAQRVTLVLSQIAPAALFETSPSSFSPFSSSSSSSSSSSLSSSLHAPVSTVGRARTCALIETRADFDCPLCALPIRGSSSGGSRRTRNRSNGNHDQVNEDEQDEQDEADGEDDGGWANLRLHLQIEHPLFRFLFHECESAADADSRSTPASAAASSESVSSSSSSSSSSSPNSMPLPTHRGGRCFSVLISLPFESAAERSAALSCRSSSSSSFLDVRPPEIQGPLRHVVFRCRHQLHQD
jgi:hypothetical protein